MCPSASGKPELTIAGTDLDWLMSVLLLAQDTYTVTALHLPDPVNELPRSNQGSPISCAIVTLSVRDSSMDVRQLLERCPECRFVFVAETLPLRPAVARVIREAGHTVVSAQESPLVITATGTALMAETYPTV
jgi:hypothetical protein